MTSATATTYALEPPSNKSLFSSEDSESAHNHGFRVGLRKAKTFGSHVAVGAANGAGVVHARAAAAARKGANRRQALDIEVIGDLLGVQLDADGQPAVVTVGLEEIFAVDPNSDGLVTSGSVHRTETAVVTYTTRINENETSEWKGYETRGDLMSDAKGCPRRSWSLRDILSLAAASAPQSSLFGSGACMRERAGCSGNGRTSWQLERAPG